MNAKICMLVALAACIELLLLTGSSAGQLQSSATLSLSGVVTPTLGSYTYIISVSGSNVQMTDGTTGQIYYQGTNAAQVANDAIGNLTQGGNILFKVGTYILTGSITGQNKNDITLAFEDGATLFVGNGMNAPAISLDGCDNWNISGVTVNGNAANQLDLNAGAGSHGIMIGFSQNCLVDRVNIDNVRTFGFVTIGCRNVGITNSKTTSCGWNGIELGSASGNEVSTYAINNEIAYCGDVGISIFGVSCLVQNNNVHDMNGALGYGNDHWGIAVEQGNNATITGNTVVNTEYGIVIGGGGASTVTSNTVRNSQRDGIHVGVGTTVADNTVTDWNMWLEGQYAIYINGDNNNANNNTALNTAYPHNAGAMYVAGSNNKVSSNTLNVGTNLNNVVNVVSGTGNKLLSNKLVGKPGTSGSAFIIQSGATDTTIAYNDVTNANANPMLRDNGVNTMVYDNITPALLPDKNVPAVKILP
jgi:parallel beta-helix repeat protein